MAKQWSILAMILGVYLTLDGPAMAGQETIRVGIVGDQTGTSDITQSYTILQAAVSLLKGQQPDVVLHVGDLVESSEKEDSYRKRFEQAVDILGEMKRPWYLTVGDHDINPPQFQPGSADRSREAWLKELYGARVPQAKDTLYYSFQVGDYHFIALNSQETLHVDPRWGKTFLAQISDQQFDWLRKDLRRHRSAKAIVVFLHQPLWYNWSGWKRIHDLLRRYPVTTVIAGHFHYDQDDGKLDGIRYVVVGATGGSVKQGHRDAGSAHHVTVMTLNGRHADFQLLPIDSAQPMTFTPRHDMDRIQALDQVLGNLWNFEQQNPLFLKEGKLVRSCQATDPAIVRIMAIGNPLEIPVRVRVEFPPNDQIKLPASRFAPAICTATLPENECLLTPGAQIEIVNPSMVSTNFCSLCDQGTEWIWEGTPELNGQAPPPADHPVRLRIRMSFTGEQGELFLDRKLETHVKACPP